MRFWGLQKRLLICQEYLDAILLCLITLVTHQEAFLLYFPIYLTIHALIVNSSKIISNLILQIRSTAESCFLQVWSTFPSPSISGGVCIDGSTGICRTAGVYWIHLWNLHDNMTLQKVWIKVKWFICCLVGLQQGLPMSWEKSVF